MNRKSVPDSALAKASEKLLAEVSSPSMVHHCVRTYRFGEAMSLTLGLKPDWEALYVASLLHDLGLESPYDGPDDFELNGAKAAEHFLLSKGATNSLATLVRSAIELHTQLIAADDQRPEVKLLHLGALVDALGSGLEQIPRELIEKILEDSPRLDWKNVVVELVERQIAAKPHCRIAEIDRQFSFLHLIRSAPFPE